MTVACSWPMPVRERTALLAAIHSAVNRPQVGARSGRLFDFCHSPNWVRHTPDLDRFVTNQGSAFCADSPQQHA